MFQFNLNSTPRTNKELFLKGKKEGTVKSGPGSSTQSSYLKISMENQALHKETDRYAGGSRGETARSDVASSTICVYIYG